MSGHIELDRYVADPGRTDGYAVLSLAFAELLTNGHGGVYRLKRSVLMESEGGDRCVRISREYDGATGDIVFRVEEPAQ